VRNRTAAPAVGPKCDPLGVGSRHSSALDPACYQGQQLRHNPMPEPGFATRRDSEQPAMTAVILSLR
jgi:hypothetical protein